tara:strand:+ start:303 stop:980 length:678 start_codon:yes stop_codon:yes gene_type:complete
MKEKIKTALIKWASKVIENHGQWDEKDTYEAIQKLYEISLVQKILLEEEEKDKHLWEYQQAQINDVIESLTEKSSKVKSKDENLEVAPMMDTIKNMVTEMPEPETYEKLFEKIEETPTFIPKQKEASNKNKEFQVSLDKERENVNDQFAKSLSIDLNDRLAFIKQLFNDDKINYERVISQIITFESWSEVSKFLNTQVKIEYNNWEGKEEVVERFLYILRNNFKD